jgi:hypothetical protein
VSHDGLNAAAFLAHAKLRSDAWTTLATQRSRVVIGISHHSMDRSEWMRLTGLRFLVGRKRIAGVSRSSHPGWNLED